jgi:hypothetical protein
MRQQWILAHVRDNPGLTLKEIAEQSPIDLNRTAEWYERFPRDRDLGFELTVLCYGTAAPAMRQLLDRGLIRREGSGTKDNPSRHHRVSMPRQLDPLEQAFASEAAVR